MRRHLFLLLAVASAVPLLATGCSKLTAPSGDDPKNLPQLADDKPGKAPEGVAPRTVPLGSVAPVLRPAPPSQHP